MRWLLRLLLEGLTLVASHNIYQPIRWSEPPPEDDPPYPPRTRAMYQATGPP